MNEGITKQEYYEDKLRDEVIEDLKRECANCHKIRHVYLTGAACGLCQECSVKLHQDFEKGVRVVLQFPTRYLGEGEGEVSLGVEPITDQERKHGATCVSSPLTRAEVDAITTDILHQW